MCLSALGGFLEEALEQYTRSKENGIERAGIHIRNVSPAYVLYSSAINLRMSPHVQVSAKILGKRMKDAVGNDQQKE